MASVSIRMKKTSNVAGRVAHDFRKRTPGYADKERKKLNVTLLGQPIEQEALRKQLDQAHREKNGKARRKDSALIWEGIITFSADADLTNREAFDQAALNLLNEIADRHGFKKPLWVVRHEDESRPHYHFAFSNAHAENAKPVRLSPNDMRQLQDLAGQCFEHLGISRGKPKEQRIKNGEPAHKWINRSVQQLHNDLPEEIEALKQRIEELTEKERKNAERLEKTLLKIQEAEEENKKLQKRAETYKTRLERTQKELAQAQSEIKRLKRLIEPQKTEPVKIKKLTGWKEAGWGPFKRQEAVLKPIKIITLKQHEQALIATRKAAEAEAKQKAEQAVQNELNLLRRRNRQLEQQLEQEHKYQDLILNAIHQASEQSWLTSAKQQDERGYDKWTPSEDSTPKIIRYNATLLDFETRLVAVGDGTPLQQASAIYSAAREKGWEKSIFWGVNEDQIEWLVEAAEKDGYEIDFEEDWAKAYAEEVRQKLLSKQRERSRGWELEM